MYLTVIKHPQGIKDNFHSILLDRMTDFEFLIKKFEISLSPAEQPVNGFKTLQSAVRGVYGIPLQKIYAALVG
ncbi:MAG: hypothetical protein ABII06_01520 [Pseudomonadota bacterium]